MSPQIYRRGKHTGERDLRDLQTEERITERKAARQAREASGSRRVQGRRVKEGAEQEGAGQVGGWAGSARWG